MAHEHHGLRGRAGQCSISTEQLNADANAKEGRLTRVFGLLRADGSIEGLLSEVPPASYRFSYHLVTPQQGVVGWETQAFQIEISVENNGPQPIHKVSGRSRMWQMQSPNDESKKFDIGDIPPGRSRSIRVTYTLFNYLIIGKTSMPKVEAAVESFEW